MNKSFLVVLAVAVVFFVSGCACCKSKMKKTCPMADMKAEEMAMPAEVAVEAVVNAEVPVVQY